MNAMNRTIRGATLRVVLLAAAALAACGEDKPEHKGEVAHPEGESAEKEAGHGADAVVLDSAALRLGGIVVGVAEARSSAGLPVTGSITYDPNRVSHIGARTQGRVTAVRADIGQAVRSGQVLAVLESPEVGQLRVEEREARELVGIARENFARERRLEQQGITSRKELLEAEAELRRAESAQRSASERLRVLGAGAGRGAQFTLISPFTGVVVDRNASLSEMAGPETTLFTVADLSRVWIELDVFERDLARVRMGQPVRITVAAYPARTFIGRIVQLGQVLDSAKRTARARVEIPNGDRALKPGMFAKASIEVGAAGGFVAVVPRAAVQEVEGKQVVFVPGTKPGEFRAVPVELGETLEGGLVAIRAGIRPGAAVVVTGAFALRSELQKEELEEGGH